MFLFHTYCRTVSAGRLNKIAAIQDEVMWEKISLLILSFFIFKYLSSLAYYASWQHDRGNLKPICTPSYTKGICTSSL